MQTTSPSEFRLSSTQIGSIAEAAVASGLMLASGGRLSPYRPVADDDGIDILLVDKKSREIVQLQIKSRTHVDNDNAKTVQFDVRTQTFVPGDRHYILAALMNEGQLACAWLIPAADIDNHARRKDDKYVIVASAKPSGQDKFEKFRCYDYKSLAERLLADSKTPVIHNASPASKYVWKPGDVKVERPEDGD